MTEYPGDSSRYGNHNNWYSGDGAWYYFDNNGVPAYLDSNAATLNDATTRINGDCYFFDAYGRMRSGLLGFTYPDGSVISAYFGDNDSDGRMKTDRQTNVIEESGECSTFFLSPGIAFHAVYTLRSGNQ